MLRRNVLQSAVKNVFIRGSVVRYVHLPASAVDVPLLEDATRRGTLLLTLLSLPRYILTCRSTTATEMWVSSPLLRY